MGRAFFVTPLFRMTGLALGILVLGIGTPAALADSTAVSNSVDCSSFATIAANTSLPADTQSKAADLLNQCLAAAGQGVANNTADLKNKPLNDALSALSAVKGNQTGALSNPNNLGHLGAWLAARATAQGAYRLGGHLAAAREQWKASVPGGNFLLVKDTTALAARARLDYAMYYLKQLNSNLDALTDSAADAKKLLNPAPPAPPAGGGQHALAFLSLGTVAAGITGLTDVVSAAQSLAALFKSNSTASPIDITGNGDVLTAGILKGAAACSAGPPSISLRLPYYSSGGDSAFVTQYRQTSDTANKLRATSADLKTAGDAYAQKNAKDGKPAPLPPGYASILSQVDAVLASFDAFDKILNTPDANGTTPFQLLLQTETIFRGDPAILLVALVQSGASSVAASHTFSNDDIAFQASGAMTAIVIAPGGNTVWEDFVPVSEFSQPHTVGGLKTLQSDYPAEDIFANSCKAP